MDLYACGSNALGQLRCIQSATRDEPENITSFEKLELVGQDDCAPGVIDVLFAGFSQTVVIVDWNIIALGHRPFRYHCLNKLILGVFGDHDGLIGCIDISGILRVPITPTDGKSSETTLSYPSGSPQDAPRYLHVAVDGAGHTTALIEPADTSKKLLILDFNRIGVEHCSQRLHNDVDATSISETERTGSPATGSFLAFNQDKANPLNAPLAQHYLAHKPNRYSHLVANNISFTFLDTSGRVWTWTLDKRQGANLGREVDEWTPASTPSLVEALDGLNIAKIAAGGWMTAALSEAGECYIWGQAPATHEDATLKLQHLGELFDEQCGIYKVQCQSDHVADGSGDDAVPSTAGPDDIVDVAIGGGHIVVLAGDGQVWAAGRNAQGQLGIGAVGPTLTSWHRAYVPGVSVGRRGLAGAPQVYSLHAGENTSFAIVGRLEYVGIRGESGSESEGTVEIVERVRKEFERTGDAQGRDRRVRQLTTESRHD